MEIDYQVEIRFKKLLEELGETFGGGMDLDTVLFLIGVQEVGKGFKEYTKRQKIELMHVGVCTVLELYGFYKTKGRDKDNWPHFELVKKLPNLNKYQQQQLMKEAVINYFEVEKEENANNIEIPKDLRYFD